MNVISNILYWISTGLLVPVIVLLIFFFIRSLILIGTFFGQYINQKKAVAPLCDRIKVLTPDKVRGFYAGLPAKSDSVAEVYVKKIIEAKDDGPQTELLLAEYEMDADKNIASSKVLTKMGPILGLMGTLIPMGPALVGLSTGDIASMAYNMQVAFATTVVGLVVSAIGFLTQQSKERWSMQTLTILDFLADIVKQSNDTEK